MVLFWIMYYYLLLLIASLTRSWALSVNSQDIPGSEVLSFEGHNLLEYRLQEQDGRKAADYAATIRVLFRFKARKSGALVAFRWSSGLLAGIVLERGKIRLLLLDSSKKPPAQDVLEHPGHSRVTSGRWYQLSAVIGQNTLYYTIDGKGTNWTMPDVAPNSLLSLYIGGFPRNKTIADIFSEVKNFTGCLTGLLINEKPLRFDSKKNSRKRFLGNEFQEFSLPNRNARLILNKRKLSPCGTHFFIKFEYHTRMRNALLAKFTSGSVSIILTIINGILMADVTPDSTLIWKTAGSSTTTSHHATTWNNISLYVAIETQDVRVIVNGKSRRVRVPFGAGKFSRIYSFQIGGKFLHLDGVIGCVRNVQVQGEVVDFNSKDPTVRMIDLVVGRCMLNTAKQISSKRQRGISSTETSTVITETLLDETLNGTLLVNVLPTVKFENINATNQSVIVVVQATESGGLFGNSDIVTAYTITIFLVVVVFGLILVYVLGLTIKNKFHHRRIEKRAKREIANKELMQYTACATSDDCQSTVSTARAESQSSKGGASSLSDQQVRFWRERDQRLMMVQSRRLHLSSLSLAKCNSKLEVTRDDAPQFLTPQPPRRHDAMELPCVILTNEEDDNKVRIKRNPFYHDKVAQRSTNTFDRDIKENILSKNTKENAKPSDNDSGKDKSQIQLLTDRKPSSYRWAYIRPDSDTECSDAELLAGMPLRYSQAKSKSIDSGRKPFPLTILETDESLEEGGPWKKRKAPAGELRTFMSKSSDNIPRMAYLKISFDPESSSSTNDEGLVSFGIMNAPDTFQRIVDGKKDIDEMDHAKWQFRDVRQINSKPESGGGFKRLECQSKPTMDCYYGDAQESLRRIANEVKQGEVEGLLEVHRGSEAASVDYQIKEEHHSKKCHREKEKGTEKEEEVRIFLKPPNPLQVSGVFNNSDLKCSDQQKTKTVRQKFNQNRNPMQRQQVHLDEPFDDDNDQQFIENKGEGVDEKSAGNAEQTLSGQSISSTFHPQQTMVKLLDNVPSSPVIQIIKSKYQEVTPKPIAKVSSNPTLHLTPSIQQALPLRRPTLHRSASCNYPLPPTFEAVTFRPHYSKSNSFSSIPTRVITPASDNSIVDSNGEDQQEIIPSNEIHPLVAKDLQVVSINGTSQQNTKDASCDELNPWVPRGTKSILSNEGDIWVARDDSSQVRCSTKLPLNNTIKSSPVQRPLVRGQRVNKLFSRPSFQQNSKALGLVSKKERKPLKPSSWSLDNTVPDAGVELNLDGTVPVKRPPMKPTHFLAVPSTRGRPQSEHFSTNFKTAD